MPNQLPITADQVRKHFCASDELDTYQVDYFIGSSEVMAHVFVSMCPYGQMLTHIVVWSIGDDYKSIAPKKGSINKFKQPDREKEWIKREERCYGWVAKQLCKLAREYDSNGKVIRDKYTTVEVWKQHRE